MQVTGLPLPATLRATAPRLMPTVSATYPDLPLPSLHSPEGYHVASVPKPLEHSPGPPESRDQNPQQRRPDPPDRQRPLVNDRVQRARLAPIGFATVARGAGLGGTSRVGVGQGVAVSCGSAPATSYHLLRAAVAVTPRRNGWRRALHPSTSGR